MRFFITIVLWAGIILPAGCGGYEDDSGITAKVQELCQRADDCNILDGVSFQECVDEGEQCVNSQTSTAQEDWSTAMDKCSDFQGCGPYFECWYNDVPYC